LPIVAGWHFGGDLDPEIGVLVRPSEDAVLPAGRFRR
jgi:hypothetical protein